jgi:hypothetical protein
MGYKVKDVVMYSIIPFSHPFCVCFSFIVLFFCLFWNLFLIAMKFSKLDHLVQGLFTNLVFGLRNAVKILNVYISLQETTFFKVVQLDCLVHFD